MIQEQTLAALGIPAAVYDFCHEREKELGPTFARVSEIAEANQAKVLAAFQKHRVGENHFETTTGYGYNDLGRDTLEAIYADIFGTEDALVRPQLICGTHALATALFGCLRPGDGLLYATGEPYDTLQGVIGLRPELGSLMEYGITYGQVELKKDGTPDPEAVVRALRPETKLVGIQRSKGYKVRHTLSVEEIGSIIQAVKAVRPDVICMVDNCYGEFTEVIEPTNVGADLCVGSLIFAAKVFQDLGYLVYPAPEEVRHDIVQTVTFGAPEPLEKFCQGIQFASPVDSYVTPVAWDMPGYDHPVIMAAGNFISGATIELSADAPMREPYVAYFQGALT